ncbi:MAG: 6-carboxytetrahydropterin synthase [Bacteroidetes bacterium]|nr:6-carboxytetrahydropterin synthase [Rhodothermia bacterium]MCS7154892.1 6-carboxytetrahydropterin synthase [Bacteroidota bacterium]MCX7906949.1 6-carboxytetrahydropterin synthase [Bacteroidota bacterium]MDW8137687.1 6-carboxytetrahydropterin synthase [Bacteroidota bacterium]MDW8285359.1 6-carboxytetrahydropterin synthase [Bacteroidota bacterium]
MSVQNPASSPVVYVVRRAHFCAAHRLHNPRFSEEWNRRTFGKCASPNYHGHNYVLEVVVAGTPDPDTGYVLDLGQLAQIIEEAIIQKCDHRNLNTDVDFLRGVLPSTENLAVAFWKELAPRIPRGRLYAIRLYETERNYVEYRGEAHEA